jgi:hypothetical protein
LYILSRLRRLSSRLGYQVGHIDFDHVSTMARTCLESRSWQDLAGRRIDAIAGKIT